MKKDFKQNIQENINWVDKKINQLKESLANCESYDKDRINYLISEFERQKDNLSQLLA